VSRWEKWSFHLLSLIVSLSGIVFLWMKYFVKNDDPFSVVNHPLQPFMLKLHILAAPFLVLLLGTILSSHISMKLRAGTMPNRRSGVVALFVFPLMTFSGYLLQVVTTPGWRRPVLVLHLGSSSIFIVSYLLHQFISLRMQKQGALKQQKARLAKLA
jgi:hypothetical protein